MQNTYTATYTPATVPAAWSATPTLSSDIDLGYHFRSTSAYYNAYVGEESYSPMAASYRDVLSAPASGVIPVGTKRKIR